MEDIIGRAAKAAGCTSEQVLRALASVMPEPGFVVVLSLDSGDFTIYGRAVRPDVTRPVTISASERSEMGFGPEYDPNSAG